MGLGAWLTGLAKIIAVPYISFLLLIFVAQRSILFQAPSDFADPRAMGGELITLVAGPPLVEGGHSIPRDASSAAAAKAYGTDDVPSVAALYYKAASPGRPTVVFWHGNADQLGWGAAYIGQQLNAKYGLGFFAIEYPGYSASTGLRTSEAAIYLASEQLLQHLSSPQGLAIPAHQVILMGQSVGGGAAVEMAARGHGARVVLLSPFASIAKMAESAFPLVTPGVRAFPFMVRDRFDNLAKIEAGKVSQELLVLHGDRDSIVPFSQGEGLVAAKGDGARLVRLKGTDHNDIFGGRVEAQVLREIADFALAESRSSGARQTGG